MKHLLKKYFDKELSRRGFIKGMMALGISSTVAKSVLQSLAEAQPLPSSPGTVMEGTGGELLVETLKAAKVKYIFAANGTGTGPIYDALVDRPEVQIILGLHEGAAVAMADGYHMASGQVGFVNVAKAGVPHSTSNLFNAWKDQSSIVVTADKTDSRIAGRDTHEEYDDPLDVVGPFTKWRWDVKWAHRIPEITSKAIKLALTQPGSPVFVSYPNNLLAQKGVKAEIIPQEKFNTPMKIRPSSGLIEDAAKLLQEAKSPLLYVGDEVWRSGARAHVVELAELLSMPVVEGWIRFKNFPINHPLFLGEYTPSMRYPREVDVILNLGAEMTEFRYSPNPLIPKTAKLIHISIDTDWVGKNFPTDLPIVADVEQSVKDLISALKAMTPESKIAQWKSTRFEQTRKFTEALRLSRLKAAQAKWNSNPIYHERLSSDMNEMLDKDAIIVNEAETPATNFMTFVEGEKTYYGSTGSFLGWGLGASLGVKLAKPDNQVVCVVGDGGLMFGPQALWSMARYEVPVVVVVLNNKSYDNPRKRIFGQGGRSSQTGKDMVCYLGDPDMDFALLAKSLGVNGETVKSPDEIKPALQRAIVSTRDGKPYLLNVLTARTGAGAESSWYPKLSVASLRNRKV